MRASACLLLLVLTVASGCGGAGQGTELTEDEKAIVSAQGLTFESSLEGTRERKLVASDLLRISRMRLASGGGIGGNWFNPIFGGEGSRDVMRYLRERIRVVLPGSGKLEDMLRVASQSGGGVRVSGKIREEAILMALNAGVNLWWTAELLWAQNRERLYLHLGDGRQIAVRGSRDGVIQLGEGYSDHVHRIDRMATLVHEARHSDCVGGLTREDLRRISNDRPPLNLQCGNLHDNCPEGHGFQGIPACEGIPWGAYAVEGVFLSRVATGCRNCSERDRQAALAGTIDRFSRVFNSEALLRGDRGNPDMSSRGLIP